MSRNSALIIGLALLIGLLSFAIEDARCRPVLFFDDNSLQDSGDVAENLTLDHAMLQENARFKHKFFPPVDYSDGSEEDTTGIANSDTSVVPEFQLFLLLPLFMIATLLVVTVCRPKHMT